MTGKTTVRRGPRRTWRKSAGRRAVRHTGDARLGVLDANLEFIVGERGELLPFG